MYSKTANPNTFCCVGFAPTIKGIIKMRDWLYFYIEFTVRNALESIREMPKEVKTLSQEIKYH